jgi:hypothetical protein
MPYFTDRSGETTFINDQAEYERLEKETWGADPEAMKPEEPVKAAQPEEKPAAVAKEQPGQPMPFGRYLSTGKEVVDAIQRLGETKIPNTAEDVIRLLKQQIKPTPERAAEIEAAKADDPTLGEELKKFPARAVQSVINSSIGLAQQTQAEGLMPTDLMRSAGLGGVLPEEPEEVTKRKELLKQSIRKTGRFPEGTELGYQPDWVGGQWLSEDSEWVQENIKPKSELVDFAAALTGSVGGAGLVRKLSTNPSSIGRTLRTAPKIEEFVPKEVFADGLKINAAQILKLVTPKNARDAAVRGLKGIVGGTPEMLEDLILMPVDVPEINPKTKAHYEKIKNAITPEAQLALTELMLTETDEDFDLEYERQKNFVFGAVGVTGIRGALYGFKGALKLARGVLRGTANGMGTSDAYREALQDVLDSSYEDFKTSINQDVTQTIQERLGLATSKFTDAVGKDIPDIASKARLAGDSFITQQKAVAPELERLVTEMAQQADVRAGQADIRGRLDQLAKELTVKNQDEALKKQAMLMKRLDDYARQMRKDSEWINRSSGTGKRATKNKSKVRIAQAAFDKINELVDLYQKIGPTDEEQLARTGEFLATEAKAAEINNAFQNSVLELQEQLSKTNELFERRNNLVEADIAQQMREGLPIEQVPEDSFLQSQNFVLYNELNNLVREAQEAINFQQVTPEYIADWVRRIEDVHDKAIQEGVTYIPTKPDTTGFEDVVEELKEVAETNLPPRQPFPEENPVPIKADANGKPVADTDEINRRIFTAAEEATPNEQPPTGNYTKAVKEDLQAFLDPEGSASAINQIADEVDEVINDWGRRLEQDKLEGTNRADKAFDIFRAANALTYSPDITEAALLKAVNDRIAGNNYANNIAVKALLELAQFVDDPDGIRQLAYLTEQGKINRENVAKLHHISTQLSLLQGNTRNAMIAINNFQKISNGFEIEGLDKKGAMAVAVSEIRKLFTAVKAVEPLAQQYGLGLALFARRNIPEFVTKMVGDKETLYVNYWNKRLMGLGDVDDFAETVSDAAQKAQKNFDETLGEVYNKIQKGETLNDEELSQALNLIEQVRKTNGNWNNLVDLEMTKGKIVGRIMSSATLSSPGGPLGIIGQAGIEGPFRLGARASMGYITMPIAKLTQNDVLYKEAALQARKNRLWLKNTVYGHRMAIGDLYNKLLFPGNHPDYNPTKSSLLYEQAVLDDLGAETFDIKTPFGEWTISREDYKDVYDKLNKTRVLYKVLHDAFIPGELYKKLDGKTRTAVSVAGLGMIDATQKFGIGAKSFYPGGEQRNMTFVQRLLTNADDYITSYLGNSWYRTQIEMELADKLAAGEISQREFRPMLKKLLKERSEKIFDPIQVGLDQKKVGHRIRDKQFNALKDQLNLTEELTGKAKTIDEAIRIVKNSDDPVIAGFGTFLMPVVTSFLNALKIGLKRSTGVEVLQAGYDAVKLGQKAIYKNLPDEVFGYLRSKFPGHIDGAVEFQSKYLSEDPLVREKAQEALALTIAYHMVAFDQVWSSDNEVTGSLSNTYRQAGNLTETFRWKIGSLEIPYLYLGSFGATMAMHVMLRDLKNFAPEAESAMLLPVFIATQANQFMEAPMMTGTDKLNDALAKASEGDIGPLQRLAADGLAKIGNPYLGYTKMIGRTITPGKPATQVGRFESTQYFKKGQFGETAGLDVMGSLENLLDTGIGLFGYAGEGLGIVPMVDALNAAVNQSPELLLRSRKADPYGKPGEMVQYSKYPQLTYPIQAILGRFLPTPSNFEDPVAVARSKHLLMPPGKELFATKEGGEVVLNDMAINNFHWFMNEEMLITSPWTGEVHVGMYAYINEIINRPEYKEKEGTVSPFTGVDPERTNREQTKFLRRMVKDAYNLGKWQWVKGLNTYPDPKTGELRPQRWKAGPELQELINSEAPN